MSINAARDNFNAPSLKDLQTSEIHYRRLFESAHDGILILDAITRKITDVNPFMMNLLGYEREEFLNKELWEIGLLNDEEASIAAFRKLQEKDHIRYDDLPLKTKDGQRREVEFVSNVYREGDRQVIQCNIRDNSERKKAEDAMRQAETSFRVLVESAPGIVYLHEAYPPYSNIYVSPNIKIYGYSPAEWRAKPDMLSSIVHKEDCERVIHEFECAAREGFETDLEYRIIARDGSIHWWHDKGRFVLDEDGKRTGWQGIILDITTTKELEKQLRQAQKLESVGLLTGGIAHDFNNMLGVIIGYSDLAFRHLKEEDLLFGYIDQIKKASLRSAELTHQLLAFSRQQVLQPIVLNLNEVIADTIKMLQRLISEDIQVTANLNPKVGRVNVDPGQFSQIIMNLAINARDSMPQGGKLTIETANIFLDSGYARQHISVLPGAYVMLAISDNGSGMSDETKQHLFEPFFTTKKIGQGTGLGLATVYGIVKQSGGSIEVYSEERVGTTFKIYLPRVAEAPNVTTVSDTSPEMPKGRETILLVEDEDLVRNLSNEILKTCGYTVIEARNGLEALEICEQIDCQFDLLMTDVIMPNMGGRELSEKLSKSLPNLRILFTSGYTDDTVVRHVVIETNTNFIQKPFTPESLANKIRQILDRT
jgi:PAS domain S-box-containing protein